MSKMKFCYKSLEDIRMHQSFTFVLFTFCIYFRTVYGDKDLKWHLVFRAQAGNNQSIMEAYRFPGDECSTQEVSVCDSHYRSGLLDRWEKLGIHEVKLELFKHCKSAGDIILDGKNSTMINVFTKGRVISSCWDDVQHDNYTFYFGFSKDELAYAQEKASEYNHKPVILFTTEASLKRPGSRIEEADVMAVFIKASKLQQCF